MSSLYLHFLLTAAVEMEFISEWPMAAEPEPARTRAPAQRTHAEPEKTRRQSCRCQLLSPSQLLMAATSLARTLRRCQVQQGNIIPRTTLSQPTDTNIDPMARILQHADSSTGRQQLQDEASELQHVLSSHLHPDQVTQLADSWRDADTRLLEPDSDLTNVTLELPHAAVQGTSASCAAGMLALASRLLFLHQPMHALVWLKLLSAASLLPTHVEGSRLAQQVCLAATASRVQHHVGGRTSSSSRTMASGARQHVCVDTVDTETLSVEAFRELYLKPRYDSVSVFVCICLFLCVHVLCYVPTFDLLMLRC